jgi:hypothetical protein
MFRAPPTVLGAVTCVNGLPRVEPPVAGLTGLLRAETVRHEATHGAQFAANCDSVARAWRDDPAFRMELEAEATCNGLDVWKNHWHGIVEVSNDSTWRAHKAVETARIARSYLNSLGNTLGYEDVYNAIDRWCSP